MSREELDFHVRRDDFAATRFVEGAAAADLAEGQVRFEVDKFAITANNVSYALSGDGLGYWRFFPSGEEGWGRVPAMGFGNVVASRHPQVAEGTRCFGFYPMSRSLVIEPSNVSAANIFDGAAHRDGLAPAYAQYAPVTADAIYTKESEDAIILMRGLFLTSFLAEDYLMDAELHGAKAVLITSASSKTSIALGFQVKQRGNARSVGLTSKRNLDFVKSLGCYDQVVTYDELASLDPNEPVGMVDMAGNGEVNRTLHHHFGDNLKFDCAIGATHWEAERSGEALPGAKPEFFFAPSQIQKRSADWGPAGFQERMGTAWSAFRDWSTGWLEVDRSEGRDALEQAWANTVAGRTTPNQGLVRSL
jgi:NADPH:quinone reductase-like Zn-dependent oxidoreductase